LLTKIPNPSVVLKSNIDLHGPFHEPPPPNLILRPLANLFKTGFLFPAMQSIKRSNP